LTRYLLAFSPQGQLRPAAVSTNTIVAIPRRCCGVPSATDPGAADLADDLRLVLRRHQLESALLNLAINARDRHAEAATLTIATGNAVQTGLRGDAVRVRPCSASPCTTPVPACRPTCCAARGAVLHHQAGGQRQRSRLRHGLRLRQQSGGHIELDSAVGEARPYSLSAGDQGFETEDIVAHLARRRFDVDAVAATRLMPGSG